METVKIKLSEIVFDETIYPRAKHDPAKVQEYMDNMQSIESAKNFIIVDSSFRLLDGRHRHLAYIKMQDGVDRDVTVYQYTENTDSRLASIQFNSSHGQQLSYDDKKRCCMNLYTSGYTIETIHKTLSIRRMTAEEWTKSVREQKEKELDQTIFEMHMACYTQDEIADVTGIARSRITEKVGLLSEMFGSNISDKSRKNFAETTTDEKGVMELAFKPPLYNVWTFSKKTNNVSHFGNSEQRIVDNLLYLYTEPFDIVVDPFAGGGSTIDACKYRLRRYWTSDRKPIPEREKEIRKHDITVDGLPPLNRNWSQVTLTYLDPPYWRQAAGQYSDDAADLANMPLEEFTKTMADLVKGIASKQSKGVIALLIQPTQWSADNRQFTDHVTDIIQAVGNKKLVLENRISCPYSTEQYNAQQVEWSKANRKLLVLTRELIVWRVN